MKGAGRAAGPESQQPDQRAPEAHHAEGGTITEVSALPTLDRPAPLADVVADVRAAAVDEVAADLDADVAVTAGEEHLEAAVEDPGAVTNYFAAPAPGWRWSVTLAAGGGDGPATVSEVVPEPASPAAVAELIDDDGVDLEPAGS